jgi:hypothetical protein
MCVIVHARHQSGAVQGGRQLLSQGQRVLSTDRALHALLAHGGLGFRVLRHTHTHHTHTHTHTWTHHGAGIA